MKKVVTSLLITLILAGCLVIGLAVSAADTPALTIRSASLSLESNVYIWFDMSLQNVDKDADDYGMIFWKTPQAAGSYTYENAQGNEAAVVRGKAAGQWAHDDTLNCDVVTYKYGIAAKEMADVVYAQGYAKVGESYYYSSVVPYSAVRYASNKLGLTPGVTGTDDENLKALLRSMLEYGAAAQKYFNYNIDNLATDILNVKYSEGLEFTSNGDGTCYVSGIGTCEDTDVVIPKVSPKWEKVVGIGERAFYNCDSLTSVVIPEGVTSIGIRAFQDCNSIKTVEIPSSVTEIGAQAFGWTERLTIILSDRNTTYHMTNDCIIETATKTLVVGRSSSVIPTDGSVTSIAARAFAGSKSLTTIEIPDGVTSIGEFAFLECDKLANVVIPASVTSIGNGAFSGCSGIKSMKVSAENENYYGTSNCLIEAPTKTLLVAYGDRSIPSDGSVTRIGYGAFGLQQSLTELVIPDGITRLDDYAFYASRKLVSITIPTSVTSIGNGVFHNCSGLANIKYGGTEAQWNEIDKSTGWDKNCGDYTLTFAETVVSSEGLKFTSNGDGTCYVSGIGTCTDTDVVIPKVSPEGEKVTSIGNSAFSNCWRLTSIAIPKGVTSIGNYAFNNCASLTSMTIPEGVMSIGNFVFSDCSRLTSITIPEGVASIGNYTFSNCTNLTSITISEGVTSIGNYAFRFCSSLTSITIPSGVMSIGNLAFDSCTSLTSITIPSGVMSIGNLAFSNCWSLTSITIPDSVTSIGVEAFYNCDSLTSITVPESVMSIGKDAFRGCTNLTSIIIPDNVMSIGEDAFSSTAYSNNEDNWTDGVLYIGNHLIMSSSGKLAANYEVKAGTKLIAGGAFNGCDNLTNITIPESVTGIGSKAFSVCTNLANITIPNSVTSIGDCAFSNCTSLTSITIPDSVTSIGSRAFWECNGIKSITIPHSVTSLGEGVLAHCSRLESISVDPNNNVYYSTDNCLIDKSSKVLIAGCKNSIIPTDGSVTSIGEDAFYGCDDLTSITIPDSVTSIGDCAFNSCYRLASITIPKGVTSIGGEVFAGCSGLENISVDPENSVYCSIDNCLIDKTSKELIAGCKNSVIPTDGSVTRIGNSVFYRCTGLTNITIPDGVKRIGSSAFSNCTSLTSITIPKSVTSIGEYAFNDCKDLKTITFQGTEKQWKAIYKGFHWDYNLPSYTIIFEN